MTKPLPVQGAGRQPFHDDRIDMEGLRAAGRAAKEARCVRRQVGAAIYNYLGWWLTDGHNGAPEKSKLDCLAGDCPRGNASYDEVPAYSDYGNCIAVHAELRALLRVTPLSRINGVMYITDAPCHGCGLALSESGLYRVVWPGGSRLLT